MTTVIIIFLDGFITSTTLLLPLDSSKTALMAPAVQLTSLNSQYLSYKRFTL